MFLGPFNVDEEVKMHMEAQNIRRAEKMKKLAGKKLAKEPHVAVKLNAQFFDGLPSDDRREALAERKNQAKAIADVVGKLGKLDLISGTSEKIAKKSTSLKTCIDVLETVSERLFILRYPDIQHAASINERSEAVRKAASPQDP